MNPFSLIMTSFLWVRASKIKSPFHRKFAVSGNINNEALKEPETNENSDHHFMKLALRHAQHAFRSKEIPVGAAIIDEAGVVLATARNSVESTMDATAHAEIQCLRMAASLRDNWRLSGCTLYSTLEPCPMCMGAIQAFRVKRVVFAASDHRLGALGSWVDLISSKHPYHEVSVTGGVLEDESALLLRRFFQMRRRENLAGLPICDRGLSYDKAKE